MFLERKTNRYKNNLNLGYYNHYRGYYGFNTTFKDK